MYIFKDKIQINIYIPDSPTITPNTATIAILPCFNSLSRNFLNSFSVLGHMPTGSKNPNGAVCTKMSVISIKVKGVYLCVILYIYICMHISTSFNRVEKSKWSYEYKNECY